MSVYDYVLDHSDQELSVALITTKYFLSKTLASGVLAKHLRSVMVKFAKYPDSVHFVIDEPLANAWHETRDPASWADIDTIQNLGLDGFQLRAWFQDLGNHRMHFAIRGHDDIMHLTVASQTLSTTQEFFDAIVEDLGLEETEDPFERLREDIQKIEAPLVDFSCIVSDTDLSTILNSRWIESNVTFYAQAFLSTIIMLGSILEGVLLHKVESHPEDANRSISAPKKDGKVLPFYEWTLENLISVSHDCGWIDKDIRDFSSALRDYRNLVHPSQQRKNNIFPDAGTCNVSREVVVAALEDLSK
jgi:hypothetical protein